MNQVHKKSNLALIISIISGCFITVITMIVCSIFWIDAISDKQKNEEMLEYFSLADEFFKEGEYADAIEILEDTSEVERVYDDYENRIDAMIKWLKEKNSETIELNENSVISEDADIPESEEEILVTAVKFDRITDGSKEYAVITGYDAFDSAVWSIETARYEMAQMDRLCEIGIWEDRYYYVEDGRVIVLQLLNGSLLWENAEFGGSIAVDAYAFSPNGTLYLCGYFGPDFFAVDSNGVTLKKIDVLSNDYYWGYQVEYVNGEILITFEGNPQGDGTPHICRVNETDYTYAFS